MSFLPYVRKLFSPGIAPSTLPPPFAYASGEEFHAGAGLQVFERTYADPLENFIGAASEFRTTLDVLPAAPIYIPKPLGILGGFDNPLGDFDLTALNEDS